MKRFASKTRLPSVLIIISLAVLLTPLSQSFGFGGVMERVTNNTFDDFEVQVSDDNIVWKNETVNENIFLFDGSSVTTLSANIRYTGYPQVSGDNVVWDGGPGAGAPDQIYFYNGSIVTTLTNSSYYNSNPQVSGDNIVWDAQSGPGDTEEILLSKDSILTTVTANSFDDWGPQVSGDNIAWVGSPGSSDEIFFYDGSKITTLTDNGFDDGDLQISGDNVVWTGYSGPKNIYNEDTSEIFFYDGSKVTTLTDNSYHDSMPQISGDNIVWTGYSGPKNEYNEDTSEIFLYDGSTVTTLTDNSYYDSMPQIFGDRIVWRAEEVGAGGTPEILYYSNSITTTLTANAFSDYGPQISSNTVVWEGAGGLGGNDEIYRLSIDTEPPTDPTFSSSSHTLDLWSNDNTVDLNIHPDATDTGWGIAGYSITFSKDATEVPPQTISMADTPNTTDTFSSPALTDGQWYANLSTADNAGNWTSTTTHLGPFTIDKTKPTASLKIENGATYTDSKNVTLNISASDNLSGLWWMRVRNKGGEWSSWEDFATTKSWELSAAVAASGSSDGNRVVELEVKDKAYNHSDIVSDTIELDTQKPVVRMVTPFVSTRISKTTTFKVKWSATDASPSSGISFYKVRYRPSTSSSWRTWKANTTAKEALFKGRAGVTYYFRTYAYDNASNRGYSKVYKTIVPFNEGNSLLSRIGFNGYQKLGKSQNFLSSVRYSYQPGHTLIYKLYNNNAIGLVVTKGPEMGRAKIYVDGKHVRTVDAYSSKTRARQLIFYKSFSKKGTHYLKVVNLGTPGRARFEVDAVVVGR